MTTSKNPKSTPTPTQIRTGISNAAADVKQESLQIAADIKSAPSIALKQLEADTKQMPKNCCAITNQCTIPNYPSPVNVDWTLGIVAISASSLKTATTSDTSLNIGYQAQTLQALPFYDETEITEMETNLLGEVTNPQSRVSKDGVDIRQYFLGSLDELMASKGAQLDQLLDQLTSRWKNLGENQQNEDLTNAYSAIQAFLTNLKGTSKARSLAEVFKLLAEYLQKLPDAEKASLWQALEKPLNYLKKQPFFNTPKTQKALKTVESSLKALLGALDIHSWANLELDINKAEAETKSTVQEQLLTAVQVAMPKACEALDEYMQENGLHVGQALVQLFGERVDAWLYRPVGSTHLVLQSGTTKLIVLDDWFEGEMVSIYTVLFAQANNLFPVQTVGMMKDFMTGRYAPFTVVGMGPDTATQPSPTVNALIFYQQISAYPSSSMAQQFGAIATTQTANASSQPDPASVVNLIEAQVSSFFQSTTDYQNVTLTSYEWVSSYIKTYPDAWAQFQISITFYLWGPPVHQGDDPENMGTITLIQQDWTSGLANLAKGSHYLIYYNPKGDNADNAEQSNSVPLYFANAQLVSSLTEDIPVICLQFIFTPLSTYTKSSSDYGTVIPSLSGNLYNTQVLGYPVDPTGKQKFDSAMKEFYNSTGFKTFMDIMNVGMLLHFTIEGMVSLFNLCKRMCTPKKPGEKEEKAEKNETTEQKDAESQEEVEEAVKENNEIQNKNAVDTQKQLSNAGDENFDPNANLSENQTSLQQNENAEGKDAETNAKQEEITKEQDQVNVEQQEISKDGQVGTTSQLETDANAVKEQSKTLDQQAKKPQDVKQTQIQQNEQSIQTNQTSINQLNQADAKQLNTEEQEQNEETESQFEEEQTEENNLETKEEAVKEDPKDKLGDVEDGA